MSGPGEDPLDALGKRIDALKPPPPAPSLPPSASNLAVRIVSDLVAGIGLGAVGGYYLDKWLATTPVLLIVCVLLGAGGGTYTALKGTRS